MYLVCKTSSYYIYIDIDLGNINNWCIGLLYTIQWARRYLRTVGISNTHEW